MVRLQKFLAECGVASRRKAEKLIAEGRVQVNGATANIGDNVDPATDSVDVDGNPVRRDSKVYLVLNKPRGVVTTVEDTHGRNTVLGCIHGVDARVFPVGRLDLDVSGVLLLTNDGELAHRLTHPSFQIDKVYVAWVTGNMADDKVRELKGGVELEDGLARPMDVSILKQGCNATRVRLVMREGRKREVKRMMQAVGHPVRKLCRISLGGIDAKGLRPGAWRHLRPDEVCHLRDLAGLH